MSEQTSTEVKSESSSESTTPKAIALRYRELPHKWQMVMAAMTACAIALAINQIFNLGFFVGYVMLDSRYMYLITGIMLSMVFITFPANKNSPHHVPWYDIVIMVVIGIIFSYFAYFAERIVLEAWEYAAPDIGIYLAMVTWVIVLEAGRRAGALRPCRRQRHCRRKRKGRGGAHSPCSPSCHPWSPQKTTTVEYGMVWYGTGIGRAC